MSWLCGRADVPGIVSATLLAWRVTHQLRWIQRASDLRDGCEGRARFVLLFESLPDGAVQSAPHRSVYLLADPLGKLTVYQLPGLWGRAKD